LIRSPKSEVEAYAKVFSRHNIPFDARRSGYFDSIEVLDLVNLLTILDNPLQDRPLLGVLRSPIGCFSIEELAALAGREHATLFAALRTLRFKGNPDAQQKAARFLDRFDAWRRLSQSTSLAARLEEILEETSYEDWLLAQPRGMQRRANVRRFVEIARQFDAMRGEGLHPFLQFLEDQMENSEMAPPPVDAKDAVRLVTVHNSKGLQYPVVALAGLGKRFNESDFDGSYLIDAEYGLTLRVRPPGMRRQYPSVPYHLARERQRKRMRDEEMRILYVALTRAQFNMILVARPASKKAHERWMGGEPTPDKARSFIDWIAPWLSAESSDWLTTESGAVGLFSWRHHAQVGSPNPAPVAAENADRAETAKLLTTLRARLDETYPHESATLQEAKSSATALRRQRADEPELVGAFDFIKSDSLKSGSGLRGNEAGAALHLFLEHAELSELATEPGIEAERDRLLAAKILSQAQAAAIDLAAVASFWTSEFGRELLAQKKFLHREHAFTAKFTAADLARAGIELKSALAAEEFIVVQGAADLVALLEKEIWLVDFKTDHLHASQVAARAAEYAPQLMIYATALARIYKRPVTRACLHFLALDRTEWLIAPAKGGKKAGVSEAAQLSFELPG
jgi:ATP-dependent helicase/nuclease subunit A